MSITDSLLLKIDGIFVKDIKTTPNDYAVVKSINEIGHFMGKKTIVDYPFAGIKKGCL
jgi:EAL domain-containing protein (putative c-di-GMP-specific phosphodiesterase class I)